MILGYEDTCRECGCTADRACYRPDHGTCWWVEEDLCSHCARPWAPPPVPARRRLSAAGWVAVGLLALVYVAVIARLMGRL